MGSCLWWRLQLSCNDSLIRPALRSSQANKRNKVLIHFSADLNVWRVCRVRAMQACPWQMCPHHDRTAVQISEHGLLQLKLIRVVIVETLEHMLSSQPCNMSDLKWSCTLGSVVALALLFLTSCSSTLSHLMRKAAASAYLQNADR